MNYNTDNLWVEKNATLSDKSAKKEYGLTSDEIISGMRNGRLQYREGNMMGNPWYRLLRVELEEFVISLKGEEYLNDLKRENEIKEIDKKIRKMKREISSLETRKLQILSHMI